MIIAVAALALLIAPAEPRQVAQAVPDSQADQAVRLADIEVTGRPVGEMIDTFVERVGAPAAHRGLARWRHGVCVGVLNMRGESARYLVDRISDVARGLGLNAGEPGCDPTILIVATVNASEYTQQMTAARPWVFRAGGSGMDRGGGAFRDFQTTDRPVRWWAVSYPADSDTGQRAARLPGEVNGPGVSDKAGGLGPADYAPVLNANSASRLRTELVDDLSRVYVVVDVDEMGGASIAQLADYVAMISLAQVNPEADTGGYATILNLFNDPEGSPGLTDWDTAYLRGLYSAQRNLSDHGSYLDEIASEIGRAHAVLRAARQDDEGP